jgi:pyruvoyl-dependent arginine decarboxylase (PvlArgDC)
MCMCVYVCVCVCVCVPSDRKNGGYIPESYQLVSTVEMDCVLYAVRAEAKCVSERLSSCNSRLGR